MSKNKLKVGKLGKISGSQKIKQLEEVTGMSIDEIIKNSHLLDTHRDIPKADGGEYEDSNLEIVIPVEHMKYHGNYRERTKEMDELKTSVDDRNQAIKMKNGMANQLRAYSRRTDKPAEDMKKWLEDRLKEAKKKVSELTYRVEKEVKNISDPMAKLALEVMGLGPVTIAYMLVYVDLDKACHASSLWSYVGLDKPSHERYKKGQAGGGNKTLRTVLYTFAAAQIKLNGPYRPVYDRVKERLEKSDKVTKSRNTQGKLIDCAWKDTKPSHRHGAGIRVLIKHFLADWWYMGRTLKGLPTDACYAEAQLGKTHKTIAPEERGWSMDKLKVKV